MLSRLLFFVTPFFPFICVGDRLFCRRPQCNRPMPAEIFPSRARIGFSTKKKKRRKKTSTDRRDGQRRPLSTTIFIVFMLSSTRHRRLYLVRLRIESIISDRPDRTHCVLSPCRFHTYAYPSTCTV